MKRNILVFGAIALASAISGIYFSASKITPAASSAAALSPVVAQLFKQSLPDSNGKEQPLAQFQGKALVLNLGNMVRAVRAGNARIVRAAGRTDA
ncbi:hypothetical protein ACFQAT_22515 [Undibacterium arcticum]|uniref:hypothetical protein n=1 Tax=Undibacterium arcticum TaxID=1762892 RepID=UPI00361A24AF